MSCASILQHLHPRYGDALTPHRTLRDHWQVLRSPSSGAQLEVSRALLQAHIEHRKTQQLRAYGWTDLDVCFTFDLASRHVTVTGRGVTFEMLLSRRALGLTQLVLPGWRASLSITKRRRRRPWCALRAPLTNVLREWPGSFTQPSLSTELRQQDGPVQILAQTRHGTLIRSLDGAVGWTVDDVSRLGSLESAPVTMSSWLRLADLVRSYLGAPYKLGGTTSAGLDCSGFTQRIYRDGLGMIIPRHSRDQSFWQRNNHDRVDGRLAFITLPGGPYHVGVVMGVGRRERIIVHASSTRRRVIEEPWEPQYKDNTRWTGSI